VHKRNPQGHKGMAETENQKKKMPRFNVYIDKIKAICKNQVLSSGTSEKTSTARLMREEISTH